MHAPNGCCILKYLLVDIKEDVGIMFKIMSFLLFCGCLFWRNKNLLAVNHCDLEVTPSLSKCLQLHLSCLTRTTLAWATNIWITKILGWTSTGRKTQIIFHASACTECSSHSQSCSETWTAEMLCVLWCDFYECNLMIGNVVKTSLQPT